MHVQQPVPLLLSMANPSTPLWVLQLPRCTVFNYAKQINILRECVCVFLPLICPTTQTVQHCFPFLHARARKTFVNGFGYGKVCKKKKNPSLSFPSHLVSKPFWTDYYCIHLLMEWGDDGGTLHSASYSIFPFTVMWFTVTVTKFTFYVFCIVKRPTRSYLPPAKQTW